MEKEIDRVGKYAGLLAGTEIGLGGVLHAARIPLRGQFLSLNQIFLLMRASAESEEASRFAPVTISNIAALLKSLTPIGNKLTPMLAISMQGVLFNLGLLLFGNSFVGRMVGGCFASLWAFIQPLLLYGLIFGSSGFEALTFGLKNMEKLFAGGESVIFYILAGLVTLKMAIVVLLAYLSTKLSDEKLAAYTTKMNGFVASSKQKNRAAGALRQICKPVFLLSVALSALLLFFAEGDLASLVRHLLQPLAIGFLLFYAMRLLPLEKILTRYEKAESGFGRALRIALQRVRD